MLSCRKRSQLRKEKINLRLSYPNLIFSLSQCTTTHAVPVQCNQSAVKPVTSSNIDSKPPILQVCCLTCAACPVQLYFHLAQTAHHHTIILLPDITSMSSAAVFLSTFSEPLNTNSNTNPFTLHVFGQTYATSNT